MFLVTGQSDAYEPEEALESALRQCEAKLGDREPHVGILYTSFLDIDHGILLERILERFPGIGVTGCTTDGEFSDVASYGMEGVVLGLMGFENGGHCSLGIGEGVADDTASAVSNAVDMAMNGLQGNPGFCVTMPDGLSTFTNPVANSLNQALEGVTIVGGSAGDCFRVERTYQFFGKKTLSNSLPVLLFSGQVKFSCGFASGCRPIGPEFIITDVEGAAVKHIGDRSALGLYREYLGEEELDIRDIAPFSLAVYDKGETGHYMRAPAAIDVDNEIVHFAAEISVGAMVRLTRMGREEIIRAARESAEKALAAYPGHPQAVLLFSCTSRRQILGTRTSEEWRHVFEVFPGVPFMGFYTYGEFCPLDGRNRTHFHNSTFVTCCIGE